MDYESDHNVTRTDEPRSLEQLQLRIQEFMARFGPADSADGTKIGVNQTFIDSLDRVDKKDLKSDEQCVICALAFLEDPYPLVVSLPCPGQHRFDLLCVSKWLESRGTCPMCRYDFVKNINKKKHIPAPVDDEEPYDDMFG